jgi:hypothetical protein
VPGQGPLGDLAEVEDLVGDLSDGRSPLGQPPLERRVVQDRLV